jgi:hypothetical protein
MYALLDVPVKTTIKNLLLISILLMAQGCAGFIIGTTTDAAIAVAKIPFKVGGAVIDVATGDEDD